MCVGGFNHNTDNKTILPAHMRRGIHYTFNLPPIPKQYAYICALLDDVSQQCGEYGWTGDSHIVSGAAFCLNLKTSLWKNGMKTEHGKACLESIKKATKSIQQQNLIDSLELVIKVYNKLP